MGQQDSAGAGPEKPSAEAIDIAMLKREVDALQVEILSSTKPWYMNISTVLSVVAMLFSFGTTFVSYRKAQDEDIQRTRVELRGLLQRLAALPKENIEIRNKYRDDPAAFMSISGYLNQENTLLTRQAVELSNKIPAEYLSSTEYQALALAMQNAYYIDGARELYAKAIEASDNINDRSAALRGMAHILFVSGRTNMGRATYRRALNVFSELTAIYDDYTQKSAHIVTELAWAFSEMTIGQTAKAVERMDSAEKIVDQLLPGPGTDQIRSQIQSQKAAFSGQPPEGAAMAPAIGVDAPGMR